METHPHRYKYEQLDVVKEPSNTVFAEITYRTDPEGRRLYSFAVLRDYVAPNGEQGRTAWLFRKQIGAIRDLLDLVENRLDHEEKLARIESRISRTRSAAK